MKSETELHFVESVCLPLLRRAQNQDGGWGFLPGSESRVEPTCWALQALLLSTEPRTPEVSRAFQFLYVAQLQDGSWPSVAGDKTGSWVTALACWLLLKESKGTHAATRGLSWLCEDWPRDSSPWRRLLAIFSRQRDVFPINNSYRGWGWTPRTSSWVEPTAFVLMAFAECPPELLPAAAAKRRHLAEALLRDRMCPGGGWNCGNPRVYGVAGEPLAIPTVFALLALLHQPDKRENTASLSWLEGNLPHIQGLGSLAAARLCLQVYGREWPDGAPEFSGIYEKTGFLPGIQVAAWCCLALHANKWLLRSAIRSEVRQ